MFTQSFWYTALCGYSVLTAPSSIQLLKQYLHTFAFSRREKFCSVRTATLRVLPELMLLAGKIL